ncbi:hypothetical protein U1Q18_010545 [Sarracenia purpurea var. burkii]
MAAMQALSRTIHHGNLISIDDDEAINRAIDMYDDVWCLNKKLIVMRACDNDKAMRKSNPWDPIASLKRKSFMRSEGTHSPVHCDDKLKEEPRKPNHSELVVEANEVDEEWLKPCVVGIIKERTNVETVPAAMSLDGVHRINVKALGENKALITLSNTEGKK